MAQQSEMMSGCCFSSPLIKMEIFIMQKALSEVRNNGNILLGFLLFLVLNMKLKH